MSISVNLGGTGYYLTYEGEYAVADRWHKKTTYSTLFPVQVSAVDSYFANNYKHFSEVLSSINEQGKIFTDEFSSRWVSINGTQPSTRVNTFQKITTIDNHVFNLESNIVDAFNQNASKKESNPNECKLLIMKQEIAQPIVFGFSYNYHI